MTGRFQPSPAVASRCNEWFAYCRFPHIWFQPSPAVASRCNMCRRPCQRCADSFNPHRLLPAGATFAVLLQSRPAFLVSTLTGCCQPVQPPSRVCQIVSLSMFQPSPAVASRCNADPLGVGDLSGWFQPSPAVASRCNVPSVCLYGPHSDDVSTLTGCCQPVQQDPDGQLVPRLLFQPSPAVASRCNAMSSQHEATAIQFQPSPAVASRCNLYPRCG